MHLEFWTRLISQFKFWFDFLLFQFFVGLQYFVVTSFCAFWTIFLGISGVSDFWGRSLHNNCVFDLQVWRVLTAGLAWRVLTAGFQKRFLVRLGKIYSKCFVFPLACLFLSVFLLLFKLTHFNYSQFWFFFPIWEVFGLDVCFAYVIYLYIIVYVWFSLIGFHHSACVVFFS